MTALSTVPWLTFIALAVARIDLVLACMFRTDTVGITDDSPVLEAIRKASDVDESMIGLELQNAVFQFVTRNASVSRDFRVAMTQLCLTEMGSGSQNQEARPLIEGLTGMNRRVSNVRRYSIYNSIVRTNARHFLAGSGK